MSLHSEENAATGGQLDSLAAAELSSADVSGVSLNSFSPMKQPDTCPAGREVVFVCTYDPISLWS
jgi:hypothetical protein